MFNKFLIIVLLIVTQQTNSEKLKLVHYENVTHSSCGLKSTEAKPHKSNHSCFKWHKTILQQKTALNTIMYGRNAEQGEFPFTALIYKSGWTKSSACTGVVINEMWVISAAHCFRGWSAHELKIYPGITHYSETYNSYYEANNIIPYHEYSPDNVSQKYYDLALIKLKSKIDFNRNNKVNSVCLPNRDYFDLTSLSTLIGWGFLNDDEDNEYTLRMTPVIIDTSYYPWSRYYLESNNVKYGLVCGGDSGGPLIQYVNNRAVLIGTVIGTYPPSGDKPCGKNITQMTFTFIRYYIDWIENTILNN